MSIYSKENTFSDSRYAICPSNLYIRMPSCHPLRLPADLWVAFESEDEFSTLISAFVFCFVIHATGKSSQGAACRGNLPVSGMQSGQFIPFLSFLSLATAPFPFVPSSKQTIIMYIFFHATYNCTTFLHPGWMQFIQFSFPLSFVIQAGALLLSDSQTTTQSNENTMRCTWVIHLNHLPCANRCWQFLNVAVNGGLCQHSVICLYFFFFWNILWFDASTKLWGFSGNEH